VRKTSSAHNTPSVQMSIGGRGTTGVSDGGFAVPGPPARG
jgi:hypothetical protein